MLQVFQGLEGKPNSSVPISSTPLDSPMGWREDIGGSTDGQTKAGTAGEVPWRVSPKHTGDHAQQEDNFGQWSPTGSLRSSDAGEAVVMSPIVSPRRKKTSAHSSPFTSPRRPTADLAKDSPGSRSPTDSPRRQPAGAALTSQNGQVVNVTGSSVGLTHSGSPQRTQVGISGASFIHSIVSYLTIHLWRDKIIITPFLTASESNKMDLSVVFI